MEQYIGTKTVMAEPMLKGEAYDSRLVSAGCVVESEEQRAIDGYLVEYEDGYQSWSPKDVFEKAYKPAGTWRDRLVIERDRLRAELGELAVVLAQSNERPASVGKEHLLLLREQQTAMRRYLAILKRRIHLSYEEEQRAG